MIILGQVFFFLHKSICCSYTVEVPCQSASNEYQQFFYAELEKIVPEQ